MTTIPAIGPHKPRVLIMILGLALGEPLGGAERFGIELARGLDKTRIEPIVCAFWRHNSPSERHWFEVLHDHGIETFFAAEAGEGWRFARYVQGIQNIRERLQAQGVDAIHSHFQMGSLAALLLKRPLGAHTCLRTAHAGKEWGDGIAASLSRLIFTQWIFPLAFDAEIAVSETMTGVLDRRPGARLKQNWALWIPNGIPLDRFHPATPAEAQAARQTLDLLPDAWVVGTVGRLRREKGHHILLQAAAQVLSARPEARFVIIGDGELQEALQRQAAALGLGEKVRFIGARTNVEQYYHAMDLFVLPSLWEGLSTVILESMASGVPVVATDLPGTRELITPGETGWLARPNDPADLAARILEALADPPQRANLAAAALTSVVPCFSMAQIIQRLEMLYEQLAGRAVA